MPRYVVDDHDRAFVTLTEFVTEQEFKEFLESKDDFEQLVLTSISADTPEQAFDTYISYHQDLATALSTRLAKLRKAIRQAENLRQGLEVVR